MPIATTDKGLVTVFGASGFVGRHVVRALLKRGWRVRAAVRRPNLAGHLQPLGMVGWVQPIQANLRYRWSVDRAVTGADVVVNLVGILHETGRQRFDAVQDFGAGDILEIDPGEGRASWYLPFTRAAVPQVLIAQRRLTVVRPQETGEREPDA